MEKQQKQDHDQVPVKEPGPNAKPGPSVKLMKVEETNADLSQIGIGIEADNLANFPQQQALGNPLIIENIFSWLPVSDRKNFRLVCKKWHDDTFTKWRLTTPVKITRERECRGISFYTIDRYLWAEADSQLVGISHQLRSKPLGSVILKDFQSGSAFGRYNNYVWDVVTPHLRSLTLEDCAFLKDDFFEDYRKLLGMPKPQLKTLVLKNIQYKGYTLHYVEGEDYDGYERREFDIVNQDEIEIGHEEDLTGFGCGANLKNLEISGKLIVVSWKNVLKESPNLQSLTLDNMDTLRKINAALLQIQQQEKQKFLKNLKHLELNSPLYFNSSEIMTLLMAEPPLETLSFFVPNSLFRNCGPFSMQEVLRDTKICRTLRKLEIVSDEFPPKKPEKLTLKNEPFGEVEMPQLRELFMWGNVVTSLSFIKYTPNLETLVINLSHQDKERLVNQFTRVYKQDLPNQYFSEWKRCQGRLSNSDDITQFTMQNTDMGDVILEKLTHFRYDYLYPITPEGMRLLGKWMPNLRKLELVFTNESFIVACENWPELEELHCLLGSTMEDSAVTGTMEMELNEKKKETKRRTGCLGDLKKLREFRFQCFCGQAKLTDACVETFLQLENLNSLSLCVARELTKKGEASLNEKIKHVKITRNYGREGKKFDCCYRMRGELCYEYSTLDINYDCFTTYTYSDFPCDDY